MNNATTNAATPNNHSFVVTRSVGDGGVLYSVKERVDAARDGSVFSLFSSSHGFSSDDVDGLGAYQYGVVGTEHDGSEKIKELRGGSSERIALADAFGAAVCAKLDALILRAFPEAHGRRWGRDEIFRKLETGEELESARVYL